VIQAAVEKLGFKFSDIKILLGSHAHPDHMTGDALVKQLTGATVMAMQEDVPALNNIRPGGKPHPIDRVLHDGDTVALGGNDAHRTPHTRSHEGLHHMDVPNDAEWEDLQRRRGGQS
jgi:metallo-beta-lactamase class B